MVTMWAYRHLFCDYARYIYDQITTGADSLQFNTKQEEYFFNFAIFSTLIQRVLRISALAAKQINIVWARF